MSEKLYLLTLAIKLIMGLANAQITVKPDFCNIFFFSNKMNESFLPRKSIHCIQQSN